VEAQGVVWPDLVEHDAVCGCFAVEVFDYLLVDTVEVPVVQRAEAAFAHPFWPGDLARVRSAAAPGGGR